MAKYDITKWLEKQQPWLQEAAVKIQENKRFDESDIANLAHILKGEKKAVHTYAEFTAASDAGSSIRLTSIENPVGIDRLNPRKPLSFGNDQLTVIYGLNGSGKSGYVRILKRLCGKSSNPLRSNVYEPQAAEQTCTIKYSIDGTETSLDWNVARKSIMELYAIDIFDSDVGRTYLDDEKEPTYVPYEISVFTALADIADEVKDLLEAERNRLVSQLPNLPQNYSSTATARLYDKLTNDTATQLATFSDVDRIKLKSLKERLETHDPGMRAKKLRVGIGHIEAVKELIATMKNVATQEFISGFRELYDDAITNRKLADDGVHVIEKNSLLKGVGSDVWKALWDAARDYSTSLAYSAQSFPLTTDDARCVLCQQELKDDAKERLISFETYVKGTLEAVAKSSEISLANAIKELPAIVYEDEVITKLQAADIDDELITEAWGWISSVNNLVAFLTEKKLESAESISISCPNGITERLSARADDDTAKALQFEKDAETIDRNKVQLEILELEARQWTAGQSESIQKELKHLKTLKCYDKWISHAGTTAITREAGRASDNLLTSEYVNRFNDELVKLGAEHITVMLESARNIKGRGKYRIMLRDAQQKSLPSDILSEGERRVVALAAFLADTSGTSSNTTFIFDDPISSLDQEYEEKTISRLVDLASLRQVIVFTHRLSFLSIIDGIATKADIPFNSINVSSESWGTGEPDDTPFYVKRPDKALKNLLNQNIVQAKKAFEEQGSAAYRIHAQDICSNFRKQLERIVELVLLGDIVQRYRRDVQTKGKMNKLPNISHGDCALIENMMSKYSYHEHTQPLETPVQFPQPNELECDIAVVVNWINDFNSRITPLKS